MTPPVAATADDKTSSDRSSAKFALELCRESMVKLGSIL
jgi:hypothetical protein